MEMEKKNVAIIVLAIALAASGVGNIILGLQGAQLTPPVKKTLVFGTSNGPHVIDPVNSWDSASNDVIEQVAETLFTYNFSALDLPRIGLLAQSYSWVSTTELDVTLRQGVKFHDGTDFNADAAKWNFDRLLYLENCTGTLPGTMVPGDPSSLYFFPDGVTPIIDSVDSDGAYTITFNLNAPFAPFLDLLCYTAGSMLSPAATPADNFIEITGGDCVGTGPFKYDSYTPNVEVRLSAFDNYWGGRAYFDEVIMAIIADAVTRNNAMLGHEIDWLAGMITSLLDTYRNDPTIHVEEFSFDHNLPTLIYQYLGMNNVQINTPWRKAISYAVNYTYIIDELLNGLGIRANGPISPSYGAPYNDTNTAAVFDLTIARQTLVDAGIATGYPVNSNPDDAYWLANPIRAINYTYNTGNSFREDMFDALNAWLPAIGITVVDDGVTWDAFLRKLFGDYDELGLFFIGWAPDYKDPFNMLDPLFNPNSYADSGQTNDAKLNSMIATALATTDDNARNDIYKNIQWYLANRLYPHVFVYHSVSISIHSADLYGFWYNAYGATRFYPVKEIE